MNVNEVIEKIKNDSRFLRLKNVIENNPWHDHQPVYDHTMLVLKTAKEKIIGDFITDQKAKELFLNFVNESIDDDILRKDCMLLVALLHDIGKSAFYQDGGKNEDMVLHTENGITSCPGHEYISSITAPEILKDYIKSEKVINYISNIIRLHDSINDGYFNSTKEWSLQKSVDYLKARSEGFYIESLFNIYCDVYHSPVSGYLREISEKLFSSSDLYSKRAYYLK